jgi:D-serine deaminase-like pyridoxal phosphate-dependent protein
VRLNEIPTPALIVDVAALDRNIRRMADFFRDRTCKLRPHFKAHKTPEIAKRQLAAGSCTGLTCATVSEVEIASAFCDDILLANEPVGPGKCERIAAVAGRVRVTAAVDSVVGLEALDRAARAAGRVIGALVDLNVGQERCGVQPGAEALHLAHRVAASGNVALRGVMGYEGHLQGITDRTEREARTRAAITRLADTARMLQADGLPCKLVSCGGTGTYDISSAVDGITEIQAGSYALMDGDYGRLDLPFEQSFWVLGTVVSRPEPARCVVDAGHKSQTKDHGMPTTPDLPGGEVVSLNDEHATIRIPAESPVKIGDPVRLRPSHTDPTINLHDVFYAIEGDRVVGVWPIAARGYPESHKSEVRSRKF